MEKLFRLIHPLLSGDKKFNLGKLITNKILDFGMHVDIPNCHSLRKTITTNFVNFRLKNAGKPRKKDNPIDYSRTIN